jgi:hypothetical protein
MDNDIFGYGKALADLWALGGKALLSGQENAYRAFADGMTKIVTQPTAGLVGSLAPDGADLAKAVQAMATLWSSTLDLSGSLMKRVPSEGDPESPQIAILGSMLDPSNWMAGAGEIDGMLQQVVEGPRFADLWIIERKLFTILQAWMALQKSSLEHSTVVLGGWLRAANSLAELVGSATDPAAQGMKPGFQPLLAAWVEAANRHLLEVQHSEPFLRTQADLLKAATSLRVVQDELTEYYGQMLGVPTRTEMDDVHRTLTDLRREVRRLRQQMRDGTAGAGSQAVKKSG